jgi:hypothetical protein
MLLTLPLSSRIAMKLAAGKPHQRGEGCPEGEVGAVLRVEQVRLVRVDPQLQLVAFASAAVTLHP